MKGKNSRWQKEIKTAVISNPEVKRTLATLRKAEFGFLGVIIIPCLNF